MTHETIVRTGGHRAIPKTSNSTCHSAGLAIRIKSIIATLALWGLIPVAVADWLIRKGGLADA